MQLRGDVVEAVQPARRDARLRREVRVAAERVGVHARRAGAERARGLGRGVLEVELQLEAELDAHERRRLEVEEAARAGARGE